MNRDQVLAELQALKLTSGQYVVVGGAALAIRDIRDTEDIDLVVTPQLFDELAARGWQPKARPSGKPGLKFARAEAYLDVNCEAFGQTTSWLLEHAERVAGTLLVDLPTLAQFKAGYGRDKDVRDLHLISEYMRAREARSVLRNHDEKIWDERRFMRAALNEGRRALPYCLPNPPVGCVLVRDHQIIASGYTQMPGQHHAEAMALSTVSGDLTDVSAYVTLEPCSFHGRTPSCAKTIVDRAMKRVLVATLDPDPRNSGAGIKLLESAGIVVEIGMLEKEALEDLGPYLARWTSEKY